MRQLVPPSDDEATEVDPTEVYVRAERARPPDRPWIAVGMIQSIDGAAVVGGRSGSLGGPADKAVFRAVRGIADVILVGAGTVRAERYRRVRMTPEVAAVRAAVGRREDPARLAVVSGSLELDLDSDLFAADAPRPLIFTSASSPADRRDRCGAVADVHVVGEERVDVGSALAVLDDLGADVVVCEGGPSLNAQLADADLVDEWCVTIAPAVANGSSPRITDGAGPAESVLPLRLESLLEEDGYLFGRWLRVR